MLKTATITWVSFYNYGTCLQAYALQHYIESLGYENRIIDDSSIVFARSKPDKSQAVEGKWKLRWRKAWQSVHANYRAFYHFQRIFCPSIEKFKSSWLKIDGNVDSILNDESDYDVYICGSDQIWYPNSLKDSGNTFYYAAFTKKKKISYAPSIGVYEIPEKWKEKVSNLLKPFSAISVREEAGRVALQELTFQKVELVVDPTLLLSKQDWEEVLPRTIRKKEKYVLGYILTPNDTYYQIAREYAREHGMKFYLFMLNLKDYGQADKLISGSPFDFLEYVKYAEVVFTDSFHGTIFSTIFERPFYTFKRFADDSADNHNSRIDTLLKKMEVEDRLLDKNSSLASLTDGVLHFPEMKQRLEPLIEDSRQFLNKNLSLIEKRSDGSHLS